MIRDIFHYLFAVCLWSLSLWKNPTAPKALLLLMLGFPEDFPHLFYLMWRLYEQQNSSTSHHSHLSLWQIL